MKLLNTFAAAGATALMLATSAAAEGHQNIAEVAMGNEDFETLVAAVQAAGLAETLMGEGPFTVFAPTDDAFAALPEGTVEDLLKPENKDQLTAILTYHVLPGSYMAADIADDLALATVEGSDVTFNTEDGVMIEDANIVATDITASNGVIHVIDKVIMPGM